MSPSDSNLAISDAEFHILGKETEPPTLLQTTNFLYDLNLIYEFSRLGTDPAYSGFNFSRYVYYRDGRPLQDQDRLHVIKLRQESPLELIATAAAASGTVIGAVWGMVQIIEKISNFRLNREKLRLEIEKLQNDNKQAKLQSHIIDEEEALFLLHRNGAYSYIEHTGERLSESPIRVEECEITIKKRVRHYGKNK